MMSADRRPDQGAGVAPDLVGRLARLLAAYAAEAASQPCCTCTGPASLDALLPDKVGYIVEVAVGGFDDDLWRLAENMTKGCLSLIACRTEAIKLVGRFRSGFSIRQLFWYNGLPEIEV